MRRFVWLLLLIVFVAFIFYNSSMPAAESHRASELVGSILTGMGKWFGIDVPQQNLDYNIRKLAHFLEFAILGVILDFSGVFFIWLTREVWSWAKR